MKYSIDMTVSQVLKDNGARTIADRFLPGVIDRAAGNPGAKDLSLRTLIGYMGGAIPQDVVNQLDEALQEYGKDKGLSEEEKDKIALYKSIAEQDKIHWEEKKNLPDVKKETIEPGRVWLDTKGERIQAHGGAVYYEESTGTYYWYGENKEHTDGVSDIWTWGIRCYQSKDLTNWEDMGLIIEPVPDDPESNLFPDMRLDRPHIRYCEKTGKFVSWIKLSGEEACFIILQSDSLLGPYAIEKENYRPFGYKVGDFDIVENYLFMDADHKGVVTLELSEDLLSAEKEVCWSYKDLYAPFTREGIAVCERNGRKYMLTSGMTGYIPNQSDSASAENWTDEFVSTGDPYPEDDSLASYNSQFTQIFHVPDSDLYIALADRWVPEYPVDYDRAMLIRRVIAQRSDPEHYQAEREEGMELMNSPMLKSANTSIADYVWLPISFEDDKPVFHWLDSWKAEDYREN